VSSRATLFAAIAFAVIATLAAAYVILTSNSGQGESGGAVPIGGAFSLVDQDGRTRRDTDFRGQYMMVFFGYTYCPDVCPTALGDISSALEALGPRGAQIAPVFISIDPARDTPARLKEFAGSFHPRLTALTGSEDAVADVARKYRVYYARAKTTGADDEDYLMNHSSSIFLIGPDGRYVTHFSYGTSVEKMVDALKKYVG
jgi:cytochrome oxidase Cu insertion factor (SCO1/SenC/PrrC family)